MTPAWLCAGLEVALNRTLALEPEVRADLTRLSGRVLALHVEGFGWDFFVEVIGETLRVAPEAPTADAKPDVRLAGTPIALARLAAHAAREAPGVPHGIAVEGDAELLARFTRLFARIGLTPEELLARATGDGVAQRLGGAVRGLFGWGAKSARTLVGNTAEYLREETYDLARKVDAEEWADAIDTLRDDAARLEARIAKLEAPR